MLPTFEQLKHLEASGEDTYKYDGKATPLEREELKELDEVNVFINGKHLIDNYEEL